MGMTAIEKTISYEGGYSNDPDDSGGETNFGISKKAYPNLDIKNLTIQQATEIYQRDYWDKMQCSAIGDSKIAWKIFDIAVNHGVDGAIRLVQHVVGCVVDGVIGPQTLHYINVSNPSDLMYELIHECILQHVHLAVTQNQDIEFLAGWITRDLDRGDGI